LLPASQPLTPQVIRQQLTPAAITRWIRKLAQASRLIRLRAMTSSTRLSPVRMSRLRVRSAVTFRKATRSPLRLARTATKPKWVPMALGRWRSQAPCWPPMAKSRRRSPRQMVLVTRRVPIPAAITRWILKLAQASRLTRLRATTSSTPRNPVAM